jgi:hypothetical protein
MFKEGAASSCYSAEENTSLSAKDIEGIKRFYPEQPSAVGQARQVREQSLNLLETLKILPPMRLDHLK